MISPGRRADIASCCSAYLMRCRTFRGGSDERLRRRARLHPSQCRKWRHRHRRPRKSALFLPCHALAHRVLQRRQQRSALFTTKAACGRGSTRRRRGGTRSRQWAAEHAAARYSAVSRLGPCALFGRREFVSLCSRHGGVLSRAPRQESADASMGSRRHCTYCAHGPNGFGSQYDVKAELSALMYLHGVPDGRRASTGD